MSSKSKETAAENGQALEGMGTGSVGGIQDCPLLKHWIRIVVKDSDGKPVTGVQPTLEVDNSTLAAALDKTGKFDTKKVLTAATPAKITFPTLFDCDWWPEGGPPPAPVGDTALAAVADGDCLLTLASTAGFRDYHAIWDAAQNAGLKTNCPVPNALLKGDAWQAPSKKTKSESKAIDQEWTFVVRALKKPKLRMVITYIEGNEIKPWKGVKWTLTGIATKSGETGASGLIEVVDIDLSATSGTLKLVLPPLPKPKKKTPSKVPDPPPYPLPINFDDWKEEPPTKTLPTTEFEFDLKIGSLPTHKDKSGTLARLNNLALLAKVDADDEAVKRAVKAYQRRLLKQDTPTGAAADIQEDAETRHSKA